MMRPMGMLANREQAQRNVDAFRGARDKVIDKVSDVMSYPARRTAQKSILSSETKSKELREANSTKKMQQEALEKNFKPQSMKGFKNGVGVGP